MLDDSMPSRLGACTPSQAFVKWSESSFLAAPDSLRSMVHFSLSLLHILYASFLAASF
jgi:hypothetical protein